jgi:hypothetical protein
VILAKSTGDVMSLVNIVYTNGTKHYKVYWVSQGNDGDIYHGCAFKGQPDFHYSYHKSGITHAKQGEKTFPMYKTIPISKIEDIHSFWNCNVGDMEWAEKYYKPFTSRKPKNVVWVDTRLFPNDIQIQFELYLVRPECISGLSGQHFRKKCKDDYRLIQIVQDINPWLIVHIRNLKYLDVKSQT